MNIRTVFLILAVAVSGATAGYLASRQLSDPSRQDLTQARTESMTNAEVGSPIPPFELPDLAGQTVSSEQLEGRALLINFWATWCAPCRREMPELMELHEAMSPHGATVVGIALDDAQPVRDYVHELGIEYPILIAGDLEGTRLAQRYGNGNVLLPYSVFVGPDGRIAHVVLGEVTREEAEAQLSRLLEPQAN